MQTHSMRKTPLRPAGHTNGSLCRVITTAAALTFLCSPLAAGEPYQRIDFSNSDGLFNDGYPANSDPGNPHGQGEGWLTIGSLASNIVNYDNNNELPGLTLAYERYHWDPVSRVNFVTHDEGSTLWTWGKANGPADMQLDDGLLSLFASNGAPRIQLDADLASITLDGAPVLTSSSFDIALDRLGLRNSVTLFVMSDFGRQLKWNGTGTDHGWAGTYVVVGGKVAGGRLYGRLPEDEIHGEQNGFLVPDAGDTRIVIPEIATDEYFATLVKWLTGWGDSNLQSVLPNLFENGDRKSGWASNLGFFNA
jgi:Protein of unknown function (DUF1501)